MKMKDVCRLTNLTERTIRFYVEKQLIAPKVEVINGREHRDYSEKDIEQLLLIAELRKLYFSIEAIIEMLNNPKEIGNISKQHQSDLAEETDKKQTIIDALKKLDIESIDSVSALTEKLKYISINYNLPAGDVEPSFGRFDSETKEEKEILTGQAWQSVRKQKRKRNIGIAFIILISTICIVIGYKIYNYQNDTIYSHVSIPSVVFTQKFVDDKSTLIGQFIIVEKSYDYLMNNTISAKFEKGVSGGVLYHSILTNQKYATVSLQIEIKKITARKLGLLDSDNITNLNIKKILLDENLSKEYVTVVDLQGDMK